MPSTNIGICRPSATAHELAAALRSVNERCWRRNHTLLEVALRLPLIVRMRLGDIDDVELGAVGELVVHPL
jgi:hypothetical protein